MIQCQNLSFDFPKKTILNDVSFSVGQGELVALLGRNGVGKSTTIRLLAGLLQPTAGKVRLLNLDPAKDPVILRKTTGVLPEGLAIFEELSLEEQLVFTARLHGLDQESAMARVEDLSKALDFADMLWLKARQASQGTRKKLALGMALISNPALCLLDEPFEAVDPSGSQRMATLFQALVSQGHTILFSTHDLSLLNRLTPRILLLTPGGQLQEPALDELDWRDFDHHAPAFHLPAWLGSPQELRP